MSAAIGLLVLPKQCCIQPHERAIATISAAGPYIRRDGHAQLGDGASPIKQRLVLLF